MRIFTKKGKPTNAERVMKTKIETALKEKGITESQFQPANTSAELKALYNKYVPDEAEILGETKNKPTPAANMKDELLTNDDSNFIAASQEGMTEEEFNKTKNSPLEADSHKKFIDPFLRSNPNIRDYVTEENPVSIPDPDRQDAGNNGSESISEPKSYKDAFGIPNADAPNNAAGNTGAGQTPPKPKEPKAQPINPAWEDMSNSKKNKSTKRMSKWLVEIFCAFAEKGLTLWGTKDINNTKLAEYAITQEIELGIILDDIGNGVQGSVKQFFQNTALQIEQIAQFSIDEKAEISDALYEFLLEKGIAPNPTQNLAIVLIGTVGVKIFAVYMLVKPVNSVLEQLRAMKNPPPEEGQEQETQEAEVIDDKAESEKPKKKSRKKKKD